MALNHLKYSCALALALLLTLSARESSAKDLTHRLGVGYSNSSIGIESLPSLAVRYFPNQAYAFSGSLGVDTEENSSRFGLTGKIMRIVFREPNMNFFVAGGGGIISREVAGKTDSGFEAQATFGGEFFFHGLDSLSFTFEAGVGVASIASDVRFRTIADHPLRAGILFYF